MESPPLITFGAIDFTACERSLIVSSRKTPWAIDEVVCQPENNSDDNMHNKISNFAAMHIDLRQTQSPDGVDRRDND